MPGLPAMPDYRRTAAAPWSDLVVWSLPES
jgi:hypothetical protein